MDPDAALTISTSILNVVLSNNASIILSILILFLLLLTAIVAGSEVAYFSLSVKDINYIKQKENTTHSAILKLLEKPKHFIATLLICNNFLSIGVIITTNMLVGSLLNIEELLPGLSHQLITIINVLIQVVIVTFFLVLFGEVLPKVYATQNNIRMCKFTAPGLLICYKILRPLSNFLVKSTKFIEGRFKSNPSNEISSEDVEHAIELTVGNTATKEEVNIFKGILKFDDITVKQIMKTRLEVIGVPYHSTFEMVKSVVRENSFSRMPVYDNNLDEIKGILHTKDLLEFIAQEQFDWHNIMRPAIFVHETKLIKDLLKTFQQQRKHMAIVVDEFGGTSGVVTLEDIMEEIIGEIKDEFDDDEFQYKKIDANNYIFEGRTLINDVCRIIGEPIETFEEVRGESDSIAGLALEIAGRFPQVNTVVSYENFDFTILQVDKMRIVKLKLSIKEETIPDNESTE
ncbi:MAG: gliding motility-associated protein GldE [Chitinophagaceae bacterium]